jgi:endonuclease YncB( thermonuclease family)
MGRPYSTDLRERVVASVLEGGLSRNRAAAQFAVAVSRSSPLWVGKRLRILASRKGIEPLTPGLGNLCSILLSYRDAADASAACGAVWTKAPTTGKTVSMDLRAAHLPLRRFGRARLKRSARVALIAASLAAAGSAQAACGSPDGGVRIAAVDERLDLVLADGRTVKLAGVATVDPARSPDLAEEARGFLVSRFVNRDGELERLASGTDRWGRIIADLAVSDSAGLSRELVASTLLAAGYARVAPSFEARGCVAERLAVEDQARRAGLGVWIDPSTAIIEATDAEALRNSDGRLVVIEGVVRRVGFGRSRLYLDLVPKGGPTIVVPRRLEAAFARAGRALGAAAGETIRVRGALDNRLGPRLEVSEPAMIEFLGPSDAPGAGKPRL